MIFPYRDDVTSHRTPVVTYAIILANVLAFLWLASQSAVGQTSAVYHYGFIPARLQQLSHQQALQIVVQVPPDVPHQPVRAARVVLEPTTSEILLSMLTCMFLHGGWMHLLGNMWFLWIFGDNIEDRLGHFAFVLLYLFGGVLASLTHWFMQPGSDVPVIGASGAVAAVLGAYTITWPFARIHSVIFVFVVFFVDLPALFVLGSWFLMQVIQANVVDPNVQAEAVAWWAHIGGFVAGMILMQALTWTSAPPQPHGGDPLRRPGERPNDDEVDEDTSQPWW